MSAALIFALVVVPMTALLLWVVFCEVRGVPAFPDTPWPEGGELDALGRLILAIICVGLATLVFAVGGPMAVVLLASGIAAMATVGSLVWTLGQSTRYALAARRAVRAGTLKPSRLTPFHRRFAQNFRRTIIRLPVALAAYG